MCFRNFTLLILVSLSFSVSGRVLQNKIDSIWIFKVSETANDTLYLNLDSSYTKYNCEIDEHTFGTYFIKNDTLFLNQESGEFDNNFQEGSVHKTLQALFKYVFMNQESIKLVYYKKFNAITGIDIFKSEYVLKKVK